MFSKDLILERGKKFVFKRERGNRIIEFTLNPDEDLDNIIEFWDYDPRKIKGKPSWIARKDLPLFLEHYYSKGGYNFYIEETKDVMGTKKQ